MGSLMAGWDSHVPDPRIVKLERNKSVTKDEIEAYWKSKKKAEDEHLRAISDVLLKRNLQQQNILNETGGGKFQRSNSLPLARTKQGMGLHLETEIGQDHDSFDNIIAKSGWWTRSNSAFLNEPPVLAPEGSHKYVSQFHIANMAQSKPESHTGITA
ncbi:uncharacterized protein LOC127799503 [Diospyros lotus]|uniref:uncharacterized protein LOC127799503 n=1 Tax=Diospyros lotus TaxID=55363 RepID=UPI002256E660|nr:uncharacterized protein LOC127799503 [Diospyros lotus]